MTSQTQHHKRVKPRLVSIFCKLLLPSSVKSVKHKNLSSQLLLLIVSFNIEETWQSQVLLCIFICAEWDPYKMRCRAVLLEAFHLCSTWWPFYFPLYALTIFMYQSDIWKQTWVSSNPDVNLALLTCRKRAISCLSDNICNTCDKITAIQTNQSSFSAYLTGIRYFVILSAHFYHMQYVLHFGHVLLVCSFLCQQ